MILLKFDIRNSFFESYYHIIWWFWTILDQNPGAGLSRRDPARNSVSGGGVNVGNGGMATHFVTNWGDLGSVGVPAPARTPLGPLGPKMGPHFPARSAEILELSSIFGPPGILQRIHRIQRIQRIHRIQRKRNIRSRTDPGLPAPGARITVVYTQTPSNEFRNASNFLGRVWPILPKKSVW